jgi:predicted TIM-barrel fold metal-dependent hydrolase
MHGWGHAIAKLPLTPSEYFRRQCFVSCDPNERMLPSAVALAGEDVVVFATDYPHPDALAGDLVGRITANGELSAAAQQKILRANAQRCFGLD